MYRKGEEKKKVRPMVPRPRQVPLKSIGNIPTNPWSTDRPLAAKLRGSVPRKEVPTEFKIDLKKKPNDDLAVGNNISRSAKNGNPNGLGDLLNSFALLSVNAGQEQRSHTLLSINIDVELVPPGKQRISPLEDDIFSHASPDINGQVSEHDRRSAILEQYSVEMSSHFFKV